MVHPLLQIPLGTPILCHQDKQPFWTSLPHNVSLRTTWSCHIIHSHNIHLINNEEYLPMEGQVRPAQERGLGALHRQNFEI